MYTAEQLQKRVEEAIAHARANVLKEERERVSRAIYLHSNTLANPEASAAVAELIPFLYEQAHAGEGVAP